MDNLETETPVVSDPSEPKPKSPFEHWLKRQFPGFSLSAMLKVLEQTDAGVPVPYLAFFCGEKIQALKSADLYKIVEAKTDWADISRKQSHLIQEIKAQGKLTDELKVQIERSTDLDRLEDIYAPFKLKRQTLGVQAKEAGLAPLADFLWNKAHGIETPALPGETLEQIALPFAKADTKYTDSESVLKGVQDILVERISESFELRSLVRSTVFRRSKIKAVKGPKAKPNSKYSKFFDYQEPIGSLKKTNASHRYLALRRGWMEDELIVSFERPDEGVLLEKFEEFACPNKETLGAEVLLQSARLSLKGNVYTVMENEAHRHLKEEAEKHIIDVLTENLRKKVLRPGIGRKAVMGIDPGSGNHPCSLALVDQDGKLLLHLPFKLEEATDSGKQEFLGSLENLKIEAIAVAHGPRSKEVREGFRKILEEAGRAIPIIAVHEHTSSIYSSSPAGKEEFPALDVNSRRAIFVARYLQDPLSMILRLDPKFLSLGELQHEVNQGKLRSALQRAMEACVNFVGVDPNVAPLHVLQNVSGLNHDLAQAILQHRQNSPFTSREDLKKVPGLAAKFDYCAGFLRIPGAEKLDNSFIHPNHYAQVKEFAKAQGVEDPFALNEEQLHKLMADLGPTLGENNCKNICYELAHWGEDPRGKFQSFEYDPSLKAMADLKPGTLYPGLVTNVTSFGAFVDIGIEQDGLVHISELTDAQAKNPFDLLFPGDPVWVYVSAVNEEKKQISLTMKAPGAAGKRPARARSAKRPERERKPALPPLTPEQIAARPKPLEEGAPRPQREFRAREPREPREKREGASGRRPDGDKKPKREDKKARKPQRDPITGAVVKLDDGDDSRSRGGPKLATKAKPHTFNPFANLASILKEKQDK